MKIIFLDVDGVLNCRHTEESIAGFVFVSEDKILLLKEIIDRTGAQVVLSSTWRWGWAYKERNPNSTSNDVMLFEALQERLAEFGIELMDYTPELGMRSWEINDWLDKHQGEGIESYVVLDDRADELYDHEEQLVETDLEYGLTQEDVEQAVNILNGGV